MWHKIAFILLIVGGLNWLLFGIFQADLGTWLGGMDSMIWRAVYILVGLSALYELFTHKKTCRDCKAGSGNMNGMNQQGGGM